MSVPERVKELYTNDIVYRFDKRKRIIFGVVTDSYEASSDVEDDDYPSLQKGQIRVLWSNRCREQIWKQNNVRLLSRCAIPGDIVRRLEKGKETQRGYCKDTKQLSTVQILGTDKIIEHIGSDRLHLVGSFDLDDAVCLGNKFGRVEAVDHVITMQSKDGSIVEVLTSINHDIEDYWLSKRNRGLGDYCYPGQEVICTPANFEQPRWIKKTRTMKRNMQIRQRFTVQSTEYCLVEVLWGSNNSRVSELKPDVIKKLKVIQPPVAKHPNIVERRLLKLNSSDMLVKKKDWLRKQSLFYIPETPKVRHVVNCTSKTMSKVPKIRSTSRLFSCVDSAEPEEEWWTEEGEESDDETGSSSSNTKPRRRHYPPKPTELVPGNTLAVEVVCLEVKATVVWQDGTEEKDIPTTQLYYSISLDDHEFFPGEWVVKGDENNGEGSYGCIQNVNCLERTANVKWFGYSPVDQKQVELETSEWSVYDLKKHSQFVYRPGHIVKATPEEDNKMGKVIDSCPHGYVIVRWIDGTEENCLPHSIEVIPDSIDMEESESEDESNEDGQVSWETESIESYAGDMTDETTLQNMAARLDFIKNRIVYLREAFRQHNISESFIFLKDLLLVYDNSSYLDKLLGTSFFSLRSKHFQALLCQAKEKAKAQGIDLRGRLFCGDNLCPSTTKIKIAERENINKMIKLENKMNAQIEGNKDVPGENKEKTKSNTEPSTPLTPESADSLAEITEENLCVELLSMLKVRVDLAYAEIISRIGGNQALTVLTKASETVSVASVSTPIPSTPTTPEDSFSTLSPPKLLKTIGTVENETYCILEEAPITHHYHPNKFEPTDLQRFLKAVQKEYKLLKESLPPGVWVRAYSNRIDLLSVMIRGPEKTPYADGLFLFDIQLSQDYPRSPPVVHYISYSSERLNPNLYVEGKVCVSLLGTWMGRGTEVWGPGSTLLQLIVSIQGLILVAEPYYNEAGYEKQTDTQQGYENSRTYNELVVLKLVQSMTEMLKSPSEVFKREILSHFAVNGQKLCQRLQRFCCDADPLQPEFPLLPVSKGLKLSLSNALNAFQELLKKVLNDNVDKSAVIDN